MLADRHRLHTGFVVGRDQHGGAVGFIAKQRGVLSAKGVRQLRCHG